MLAWKVKSKIKMLEYKRICKLSLEINKYSQVVIYYHI